jgi:Na+/H+-dicarboxylate symporter
MKTWMTYPAAIALGFSASLLLGEYALFHTIIEAAVPVLIDAGIFILFPFVFIAFAAGISSLRRHERTPMMLASTLLWSLLTTALLCATAAAAVTLFPFPVDNLEPMHRFASLPSTLEAISVRQLIGMLVSRNSFTQFFTTEANLLPVMGLALLLGYALKPNIEVIRPAYVVANSFSEAMFRLARLVAVIGAISVGFIACRFFNTVDLEGLFFANLRFFALLGAVSAVSLLVLLPLLFALLTGFKRGNPYRIIFGSLSACLAGFFSANQLYATTILMPTARKNNQVQKRIAGTAIPLYTIIGKGGSAMVATVLTLTLIGTGTGASIDWQTAMIIAGYCAAYSFLTSFNLGFEVPFILVAATKAVGIDLQGLELMAIALLPLVGGLGTAIDTAIAAFGSAYTSRLIVSGMPTAYRELI